MENSQKPNDKKDFKQAYRTAYLIAGFLKQTLTEEEKEELDAWILASDENMILFEKMTDEKNLEQAAGWLKQIDVEGDLQQTKRKIQQRKPTRFWTYAAAAIIVIVAAGVYFYQAVNHKTNVPAVAADGQDIMPGSDMATLTLGNGQRILLGNAGTDTLINNHIRLLRKNGQLVYANDVETKELEYNTLVVPRKGKYKLVLPDGSKVWLNAESSIKYPVAFPANERRVFITGEAFFEVAKNKDKPFRVVAGNVLLEDLGTQFNVNAYNNEPYLATTLVEGSVKITSGAKQSVLKPGEQAQVKIDDLTIVNAAVDEVTAWKNDEFKFSSTSIDEIMRQVERWYDADVEFKDSVNLHLNATIDRSVPASKLLHILEQTGQVHFKIEGKKIIVSQ